VHKFAGMV